MRHAKHVVLLGASAGGLNAVGDLLESVPRGLDAAFFVVIHIPSSGPSLLPEILARRTRMPVAHAVEGAPILPGRVAVAPPSFHLVLQRGSMHLTDDAKEHGFRPSIDVLFRSAALAYGRRVVGVVLSGLLDDGTSGACVVKKRGGRVAAQDPQDALFPSMPLSVIANVDVDMVARASDLGASLGALLRSMAPEGEGATASEETQTWEESEQPEEAVDTVGKDPREVDHPDGAPSALTCPECHGALWTRHEGLSLRMFECHTGHRFSAGSLSSRQAEELEATLRGAHRAATERVMLSRMLASRAREQENLDLAVRFDARADVEAERARLIKAAIHASPFFGGAACAPVASNHADDILPSVKI